MSVQTTGAVLKARPTTYNGIKMRSRMEAKFAALLDACDIPFQYEPRAFATKRGQYLPDFMVERPDGNHYIETKAWREDFEPQPIRDRMEIILASEPNAVLHLLTCRDESWAEWKRLVNEHHQPQGWAPMHVGALLLELHPALCLLARGYFRTADGSYEFEVPVGALLRAREVWRAGLGI